MDTTEESYKNPTKDGSCQVHSLASDLPQCIPSLQDVEEAKHTYKLFCDRNKVAQIGEYVVKRGRFDTMEGWTMLHLGRMTSVSVPTVYAILLEARTSVPTKRA
jgi:hypothetical protein